MLTDGVRIQRGFLRAPRAVCVYVRACVRACVCVCVIGEEEDRFQ